MVCVQVGCSGVGQDVQKSTEISITLVVRVCSVGTGGLFRGNNDFRYWQKTSPLSLPPDRDYTIEVSRSILTFSKVKRLSVLLVLEGTVGGEVRDPI